MAAPTFTITNQMIRVTASGTDVGLTDDLKIRSILWDYPNGNPADQAVIQDAAGNEFWRGTMKTANEHFANYMHEKTYLHGLKVPTLAGGVLYIYLD